MNQYNLSKMVPGQRWVVSYRVYYDGSLEQKAEIIGLAAWYRGKYYGHFKDEHKHKYMVVEVPKENAENFKYSTELLGYKVQRKFAFRTWW